MSQGISLVIRARDEEALLPRIILAAIAKQTLQPNRNHSGL